ncbi:condensation domain-containing protein [Streptomyces sp. 4F14]|uniref:condensation domain-containing protein n=1 Tax=Streptomyces sp. 4F14 TaxID=3394380 RepID=UPI003A866557
MRGPSSRNPGPPPSDPLTALLLTRSAAVLGVPADRIDPSAPLPRPDRHPLLALRLAAALRTELGHDVPVTDLLDLTSIEALRRHLDARTAWPLAQGQLTMYRDQSRSPDSRAYHLPLLFEIHGPLDEGALERAVAAQTRIHPVLSARFEERAGVPYMSIAPTRTPSFERHRLTAESRAEQLAELRALVNAPFDLTSGPLLRTHLLTLPDGRRLLLLTAHHILLDGTSTAILVRTLKEAYRGEHPRPDTTYGDFVAWEEAFLRSPRAQRHRAYWQGKLTNRQPPLPLPYDHPYDPARLPDAAVLTTVLSPALTAALTRTARLHRVSTATAFFATYVRLLHRLTGRPGPTLGLTAAARYDPRFRQVVGQFANCLPVRCTDTGDFPALLRSAQREMAAAIEHGALPARDIANSLRTPETPLVITNFLFQNFEGADLLTENTAAAPGELDLRPFDDLPYAGEYTLAMEFYRSGDAYKVFLKYDTNVFREATARAFLAEWLSLTEEATNREAAP